MAPASIPGPSNISNGESTSSERNIPPMSFESSLIIEHSLPLNESDRGRSTDSDDTSVLPITCSPRTPTRNPLKTFRLIS